jgi:hypothetical protein
MITKSLETVVARTGPCGFPLLLRVVMTVFLGFAIITSQVGSPVILATQTDTEAPVTENETQDSETQVSEVVCVAVGRNRSLSRVIDRTCHQVEAHMSARLSVLTSVYLQRGTTPVREFSQHNGVGAMLRC